MKPNKNGSKPFQPRDIKFVSMRLSGADAEVFRKWTFEGGGSYLSRLAEIVTDGYKLSLSYYFDGSCFIATLTCNEPKDPNYNLALSCRSDSAEEALAMLVFKHDHYCNDHIWEADGTDSLWG